MNTKILKTILAVFLSFTMFQIALPCTNVIITKGASKDGSVMVTYAADSHQLYGELYFNRAASFAKNSLLKITEWDTGRYLGEIAQVVNTFQTVGNMNQYQVAITETTFGGRSELVDAIGLVDYGSLIYVTLQRAKTAREAIEIMTALVEEYGFASGGETFTITDKNEAWIMEMVGKGNKVVDGKNLNKGAVWVAARIPDGYICAHANQSRIDTFPLNDPENWIYSKDVISFAREAGYFEGEDKDFSFRDAYAPLDFGALRYCEARVWAAFNILGKGMIGDKKAEEYLDFAMGYNPENQMPLFIKPAEKVSLKNVADVMRDHYEGSPMDMSTDLGAGPHNCPYRWRPMTFEVDGKKYLNERAIATQQTGFWIVCQSRNWLPDEIGGILWFGVDDASTSCLSPIYTSINETPECIAVGNGDMLTYSPSSSFWLFNRVAQFAYLLYNRVAPEIIKATNDFENKTIEEIQTIDRKAMEILGNPANINKKLNAKKIAEVKEFLTKYSSDKAQNLFDTWQKLDQYLLVKYIDGNVKVQNPDGTFKNNGNSPHIPASPDQPGYNEKWKKAVANDNGKILEVK